jgi:hypothetical protein
MNDSNEVASDERQRIRVEREARYSVLKALIAELGARKDDPLDRLEYLLRNCGYLVERRGDRVVLSENAHRRDFLDVSPWLPFGPEALETFPWVRTFARWGTGGETFRSWPKRFVRRVHGYKIPVRCLDGLVAYLVKALGAVGVITTYSCDGHGKGGVRVRLDHGCSSAWTVMLMRYVETKFRLAQRWSVGDGHLAVSRGEQIDWVPYYLEVLDVADLLYQERVRLREIRSEIVKQLDERVEQFAYPSILLHMDLLLRGSPVGSLLGLQESSPLGLRMPVSFGTR